MIIFWILTFLNIIQWQGNHLHTMTQQYVKFHRWIFCYCSEITGRHIINHVLQVVSISAWYWGISIVQQRLLDKRCYATSAIVIRCRLFETQVYCDKMAEDKLMWFSLTCSRAPPLFACQVWWRNSKGVLKVFNYPVLYLWNGAIQGFGHN